MRITERVTQLALEPFDFRAADETLAVADACDGIEQGLPERRVLCLEVEQRNGHKRPMVLVVGAWAQPARRKLMVCAIDI